MADIQHDIDHLFRREYGHLVSVLSSRFGPRYIDLIEDAVQEALYKALAVWPFRDVPARPAAWLYRVASNELLDQLKRLQRSPEADSAPAALPEPSSLDPEPEAVDDQFLRMIFACCHPAMQAQEQLYLSLKLLCGFGVREIAAAVLKKPEAVKKAIARAKQKFRTEVGVLDIPGSGELARRLEVVLHVLYLMFNEGYKAVEGDVLIRQDMCAEAMRLGGILYRNEVCNTSELRALMALMYYSAARFPARLGPSGELVTLEHQDRSLWNKEWMDTGTFFLRASVGGSHLSRYHLEAGIAAMHTTSERFDDTDWQTIVQLYDMLLDIDPSPFVALNRVVATRYADDPDAALREMQALEDRHDLDAYYLYHAIKADLLDACEGQEAHTQRHLEAAIELCPNQVERAFLQERLQKISTDT